MKRKNVKMKLMRKIFLIIFLGSLLFPLISLAGEYKIDEKTIYYQGLVPCGKSEPAPAKYDSKGNLIEKAESSEVTASCQFCHLFVTLFGIINFILFRIVPVVAVLMLIVGGVMFYFAGANPNALKTAKGIITSVVIGLVIIFAAWVIVNTILVAVGVANWTGLKEGWFVVDCAIN